MNKVVLICKGVPEHLGPTDEFSDAICACVSAPFDSDIELQSATTE
jgi:hypothetical protein